ncbi:MAG: hypothetical protein AB8G16_01380 [Gammaproteobacteria bacterium]
MNRLQEISLKLAQQEQHDEKRRAAPTGAPTWRAKVRKMMALSRKRTPNEPSEH